MLKISEPIRDVLVYKGFVGYAETKEFKKSVSKNDQQRKICHKNRNKNIKRYISHLRYIHLNV